MNFRCCRTLLIVPVVALCTLPIAENRAHAQDAVAATQLFDLMEDKGFSEGDVEHRFYEAFEYEVDGAEYVRPFILDQELIAYGISDIASESLAVLRRVTTIFSDEFDFKISVRLVHISQLTSIAQELPPHNYMIFEPIETFPTRNTVRDPWAYLPRDHDGDILLTFRVDHIANMQDSPDNYGHTCPMPLYQRSGFIAHSVVYVDTSMPLDQQAACISFALLANAGYIYPDGDVDVAAEQIASEGVAWTDIDQAAILLAKAIGLVFGTKRDLVFPQIEQVWKLRE